MDMARTGSEHVFTRPELACNVSESITKCAFRDGINREHPEYRQPSS
jgi:hypothetical protein